MCMHINYIKLLYFYVHVLQQILLSVYDSEILWGHKKYYNIAKICKHIFIIYIIDLH